MKSTTVKITDKPGTMTFNPTDAAGTVLSKPAAPVQWSTDVQGLVTLTPDPAPDALGCAVAYTAPGTVVVTGNDTAFSDSYQLVVEDVETGCFLSFTAGV